MEMINNFDLFEDLFEDLFDFIKDPNNDINKAIKHYGGSTFYIPSYKTTIRNTELLKEYKENIQKKGIVKVLSQKYDLTERQIYTLTRQIRKK